MLSIMGFFFLHFGEYQPVRRFDETTGVCKTSGRADETSVGVGEA